MNGLTITVKDEASPVIRRVNEAMRGPVQRVFGRSVRSTLRSHFFALNASRPNALGGRRTNFYTQAGRSVQQPVVEPGSITIGIAQVGIRQRYYGGTITPVSSKLLTIPADASAHGRRAREIPNLRAIFFRGGRAVGALVTKEGHVMYWLARSATQKADPSVMPTEGEMVEPAMAASGEFMQRVISRGGEA